MSTLDFKVIDLAFPVGSESKTATLITGEEQAFLTDAGFTPRPRPPPGRRDPRLRHDTEEGLH